MRPAARLRIRFLFAVVAAAASVVVALASWRLTAGPISLAPLKPRLEEALATRDGFRVEMEDVVLAWRGIGLGTEIKAVGVRVRTREGAEIAALPEVALRLSTRALLRGRVRPASIEVRDVRLRVARGPEGVSVGIGVGASGSVADQLVAALRSAMPGAEPGAVDWGLLERVSVPGAEVTLEDRESGALVLVPGVDLVVRHEAEQTSAELEATIALGAAKPARLLATASRVPPGRSVSVVVVFEGLDPHALAARRPGLASLSPLAMSLSGRLAFPIDLESGVGDVRFDVRGSRGRLELRQVYDAPLGLAALAARGRYRLGERRVDVDVLRLESEGVKFDLHAGVAFAAGAGARLEGTATGLRAAELGRFWPATAAPAARAWVVEHAPEGVFPEVRFVLDAPFAERSSNGRDGDKPAGAGFTADFRFEGLTIQGLPVLERAAELAGTGRLGRDRLDLTIERGRAAGLDVTSGSFSLPDFGPRALPMESAATFDGGPEAILAALENTPLGALRRFGLGPEEVANGASARLRLRLPEADGAPLFLDSLDIRAGSFSVAAAASFVDGALVDWKARELRFGSNQLTADVTRGPDGGYWIVVGGERGDLRPFLEGRESAAETIGEDAYDVTFRLDRLTVSDRLDVAGVEGRAAGGGGRPYTVEAKGSLPGRAAVQVSLAPAADGRRLRITSQDGGRLLQGMHFFDHATGGRLELDARVSGEPAELAGELHLESFKIVEAPLLARVLALGSLGGIAATLRGGGIPFARADLPFTRKAGVLTLRDGRAVGAIGVTLAGTIDRPRRRIDLEGMVIPAYTLNRVLGGVPLLSRFLAGGEQAEIFGIAYSARGDLDDPEVKVNPLSALAPGILRKLFPGILGSG